MPDSGEERTQELVNAAQQLLSRVWKYPVAFSIQNVIRTWGWHPLLRCRVKDRPAEAADFVIVKSVNRAGQRMTDERAGLELLAALRPVHDLVPQLYAA